MSDRDFHYQLRPRGWADYYEYRVDFSNRFNSVAFFRNTIRELEEISMPEEHGKATYRIVCSYIIHKGADTWERLELWSVHDSNWARALEIARGIEAKYVIHPYRRPRVRYFNGKKV